MRSDPTKIQQRPAGILSVDLVDLIFWYIWYMYMFIDLKKPLDPGLLEWLTLRFWVNIDNRITIEKDVIV